MYHIFIHSSVSRHLDYFHVLAILNSAATNIEMQVPLQIMVFSWCISRSGLLGHMLVLFLVFKETSILFSIEVVPIYISANSIGGCILIYCSFMRTFQSPEMTTFDNFLQFKLVFLDICQSFNSFVARSFVLNQV